MRPMFDGAPGGARWAIGIVQVAVVLLGLGLFALAAVPPFFQARSLVVMGGSMEPSIPRGAVVLVQSSPEPRPRLGDVVTFIRPDDEGGLVTHRIVGARSSAGGEVFTTRGDANDAEDPWVLRESQVVGRIVGVVPLAGYLLRVTGLAEFRLALVVVAVFSFTFYSVRGALARSLAG